MDAYDYKTYVLFFAGYVCSVLGVTFASWLRELRLVVLLLPSTGTVDDAVMIALYPLHDLCLDKADINCMIEVLPNEKMLADKAVAENPGPRRSQRVREQQR